MLCFGLGLYIHTYLFEYDNIINYLFYNIHSLHNNSSIFKFYDEF